MQPLHPNESEMEKSTQGERANLAAGVDWDGVNVLTGAITAVANAKGKGERHREGIFWSRGSEPEKRWQGWRWSRRELLPLRDLWPSEGPMHLNVEKAATGKGKK